MPGFKKERLSSSAVPRLLHRFNYFTKSLWLYLEHNFVWVTCSRKDRVSNVSSLQTSYNKDRYLPQRDLTTAGHKEALHWERRSVAEFGWCCLSFRVPDWALHGSRRSFPQWWPPQASSWSNLWRSSISSRCIGAYLEVELISLLKYIIFASRMVSGFDYNISLIWMTPLITFHPVKHSFSKFKALNMPKSNFWNNPYLPPA